MQQATQRSVPGSMLPLSSARYIFPQYQDENIMTDLHEIADLVALERERVSVMARDIIHSATRNEQSDGSWLCCSRRLRCTL